MEFHHVSWGYGGISGRQCLKLPGAGNVSTAAASFHQVGSEVPAGYYCSIISVVISASLFISETWKTKETDWIVIYRMLGFDSRIRFTAIETVQARCNLLNYPRVLLHATANLTLIRSRSMFLLSKTRLSQKIIWQT